MAREEIKTTAIAIRTTRTDVAALSSEELVAYLDMQLALMRKLHLSEGLIFSHEIILRSDGSGTYELVKRTKGTEAPDYGKEDHSRSINASMRGYADRVGLTNMGRGGKYNDADRLMFTDYGTVELGEIDAFADM